MKEIKLSLVKILFSILPFLFLTENAISQSDDCRNGGFETNSYAFWSGKYGVRNNSGINIGNLTNGFSSTQHVITSAGFDPIVGGNLLPTVGSGNHAIRLGDPISGNLDAAMLFYTFIVTPNNSDFGFEYAMVMKDGEHENDENPYFGYAIYPTGSNFPFGTIIANKQFTADNDNPFFKENNGWVWRNWTFECVDLSNYIGQSVTVAFYSTDCAHGGHGGYAYIDGLCSDHKAVPDLSLQSIYCYGDPIIADASNSVNEDSYYVSIQESDENWNVSGKEYWEWFVGEEAGTINMNDFITQHGWSIKCNQYYKVKIAVTNQCTGWTETSRLIKVICPEIEEIPDIFLCCNTELPQRPMTITPSYYANNIIDFDWDISPHLDVMLPRPDGSAISFMPPQENTTINLTVTDDQGCEYSQEIKIWILDNFEVNITSENEGCCKQKLTANITIKDNCGNYNSLSNEDKASILSQLTYEWNNGATTQSISVAGLEPEEFRVTLRLGSCYTQTASYMYYPPDAYNQTAVYERDLIAPNTFTPNGDGINDIFMVQELNLNSPTNTPIGTPNSYGIIGYEIHIFDRWGQVQYHHKDESCNIPNGGISWDGKNNAGELLKQDVYPYILRVKTCNGSEGSWHNVCTIHDGQVGSRCLVERYCWFGCWPPFSWVCDDYWDENTGYDLLPASGQCHYSIMLLR